MVPVALSGNSSLFQQLVLVYFVRKVLLYLRTAL